MTSQPDTTTVDPADQAVATIENDIVRIVAELDQLIALIPTATGSRLWVADTDWATAQIAMARGALNSVYDPEI